MEERERGERRGEVMRGGRQEDRVKGIRGEGDDRGRERGVEREEGNERRGSGREVNKGR